MNSTIEEVVRKKKKRKSSWNNELVVSRIAVLKRQSKSLSKIDKLSYQDYMERFSIAAEKHNFTFIDLGSSRKAFVLGTGSIHLAMISGIHGEERAGPIALLKFLERTKKGRLIPDNISLFISPILGSEGWDKRDRINDNVNLNDVWSWKSAPNYIHNVKEELKNFKPDLFFDFHEDTSIEDNEPYLWRKRSNRDFIFELQKAVGVCRRKGNWRYIKDFNGCSENFIHSIGCRETTTIETPQSASLRSRVGFNLAVLKYTLDACNKQQNKYKNLYTIWFSSITNDGEKNQINFLQTKYNIRKTKEITAMKKIVNKMKKKNVENYSIYENM
jgi:hypothetical protein